MHQLPKIKLQFSAIPFGCNKIKVLNIGVTPPYLVLKSTDRTAQMFPIFKLWTFLFEFLIQIWTFNSYKFCWRYFSVTYFLKVSTSALSEASTATNLDKEKHENITFLHCQFKINTMECPEFFSQAFIWFKIP